MQNGEHRSINIELTEGFALGSFSGLSADVYSPPVAAMRA